jgi:tRNA modification GTPase
MLFYILTIIKAFCILIFARMIHSDDTICALATPNGVGAIAMIRVSGKSTRTIISSNFSKGLTTCSSHTVHFGYFKSLTEELIDEVLISVFDHGKSFTGEESAEITCHASPYIQQQIIQTLIASGCRLAEPGEFTMRAFINGKLDLSQAEAVADLIASQSKSAHDLALKQLRGGFSSELREVREKLIQFASLVELELDFSEEDVEFADRSELKQLVSNTLDHINRLAKSFELGNAIKNGVPVAIVGAPNTGKSTLLNQLLGEERAIVSNIAGTTRDVIEEILNIDGIQFRLIDTAGIREGAEEIEALGIERSKEKILHASIVVCMADTTIPDKVDDVIAWATEIQMQHPDKKVIIVLNKCDISTFSIEKCDLPCFAISAKAGQGISVLTQAFVHAITEGFDLSHDTIVSNARHYEALRQTETALKKTKDGLEQSVSGDFIAMDIRAAMRHLGNITGQIDVDTDILGSIFSKFCIGK